MRFPVLLSMLLLTACASQPVPITQKFPEPVPELMKQCEELMVLEGDKILMTDLLRTVVQNYTLYYQCANKVEGWQEWYNAQKKLFDELK